MFLLQAPTSSLHIYMLSRESFAISRAPSLSANNSLKALLRTWWLTLTLIGPAVQTLDARVWVHWLQLGLLVFQKATYNIQINAEAGYKGVANAVAELTWICNLFLELRHPITKASIVYCDNINSVYFAHNHVRHQRTKHIEIDIHFVREKVVFGEVKVMFVPSHCSLQMFLQMGCRPVCSINSEPA